MSFIDLFIKKTTPAERSLHTAYKIMNYLRDAYIKKEKAYEMGCSNTTVKYFEDRLDAIANYRQEVYSKFQSDQRNATRANAEKLEQAKAMFFEEFLKEYPDSGITSVDDVIDFENGMDCKFKPIEERLTNLFTGILDGSMTVYSKFDSLYMQLTTLYTQEQNNQMFYDLINAVFEQTNPYGRDAHKDNYWGVVNDNGPLPPVYSVSDNTYFVSIDKLDSFRVIVNALYRQQTKDERANLKYTKYLETKLSKAKTPAKREELEKLLLDARSERASGMLWLTTASNLKHTFDTIDARKECLNEQLSNAELVMNHVMNSVLLRLLTPDRIGEINDTIDTPRTHLIVHKSEIATILENSRLLYNTLLPAMELAHLTDNKIIIEKDLADYSVQVISYLSQRNSEKVESAVTTMAKKEKISIDEKLDSLSDKELLALGFSREILTSLEYDTPTGRYTFDGEGIINLDTKEKIVCNSVEDISRLFGIEPEKSLDDRLDEIENVVASIESKGLSEEEYEAKLRDALGQVDTSGNDGM